LDVMTTEPGTLAGLEAASFVTRRVWLHQLRHTAGTRAAELGLSALEIAAILGHAQASTSERYVHLARGVNHDRSRRLASHTLGEPEPTDRQGVSR
jgi:integrase